MEAAQLRRFLTINTREISSRKLKKRMLGIRIRRIKGEYLTLNSIKRPSAVKRGWKIIRGSSR
jgi:hypothetical protein